MAEQIWMAISRRTPSFPINSWCCLRWVRRFPAKRIITRVQSPLP